MVVVGRESGGQSPKDAGVAHNGLANPLEIKPSEKALTITNGDATLSLNPNGAIVRSWRVGGRELLFSNPNPDFRLRASHPIGPICGVLFDPVTRQRSVSHDINGVTVNLPLHGGLRESMWTEVGGGMERKTAVEYANTPDAPLKKMMEEQYPFFFSWKLGVELPTPNKLHWDLSFTNLTPGKVAPVDMGWHLYLPWEQGLTIEGLNGLKYDNLTVWDAPATGTINGPPAFGEKVNRDWQVDLLSAADGVQRREFRIGYPTSKHSLIMRILSQRADKMIVWTNPALGIGDFICPEPWLGERNSWKNGTAAQVQPDKTVNLKVELEYVEGK
jgi:galactose mutarotase-like enzyme